MELCSSLAGKEVNVLNLFFLTVVYYIINFFTLLFNGFDCKPFFRSKQ